MFTHKHTIVFKIIGVLPFNILKAQIFFCINLQNVIYSNGSYNGLYEIKYKRESHNNFNIYDEID